MIPSMFGRIPNQGLKKQPASPNTPRARSAASSALGTTHSKERQKALRNKARRHLKVRHHSSSASHTRVTSTHRHRDFSTLTKEETQALDVTNLSASEIKQLNIKWLTLKQIIDFPKKQLKDLTPEQTRDWIDLQLDLPELLLAYQQTLKTTKP